MDQIETSEAEARDDMSIDRPNLYRVDSTHDWLQNEKNPQFVLCRACNRHARPTNPNGLANICTRRTIIDVIVSTHN